MRPLTPTEATADARLRVLVGDHAYLEPTRTGLEKSIMDAIAPLRSYLAAAGAHDYAAQGKGPMQKRIADGRMIVGGAVHETQVSLYRPETKDGDPRIWVSGLRDWANPNDVLAVFYFDDIIHVMNLTQSDLHEVSDEQLEHSGRPDLVLLREIGAKRSEPAKELVRLLTRVAGGWIRSVGRGDTAVGRTLEHALGIAMNSSKNPDFRGIELKSKRTKAEGSKTRTSIFAQVPYWPESPCGGSEELLERYGYVRDGVERLYCQLNFGRPNSQGLQLAIEQSSDQLLAVAPRDGARGALQMPLFGDEQRRQPRFRAVGQDRELACLWYLETLRGRLREKHAETFWVDVDSRIDADGNEEFRVLSATHTRAPYATRLADLIQRDVISVDFLIKRLETGGAKDKGYLFKLKPGYLDELFPPAQRYGFRQ